TATFVVALIGAAVGGPLGEKILRANGNYISPLSLLTTVRVVVGTAAMLAVTAVLALAIGAILRRSAGAVTTAIAGTLLPMILVTSGALPSRASEWILRLLPAAGFAVQQTVIAYHQVTFSYTPLSGYFPLPFWAGFAVLCAWAVGAMALAVSLLNRRDA
ncbi:MAG: ABC transporter permease subunit, partial [Actinomycetota bacterium]